MAKPLGLHGDPNLGVLTAYFCKDSNPPLCMVLWFTSISIPNMNSLKHLPLDRCYMLFDFIFQLHYFTSSESCVALSLVYCIIRGNAESYFSKYLRTEFYHNLKSILGFQHLVSLQELEIDEYLGLITLIENVEDLKSLKNVKISSLAHAG